MRKIASECTQSPFIPEDHVIIGSPVIFAAVHVDVFIKLIM